MKYGVGPDGDASYLNRLPGQLGRATLRAQLERTAAGSGVLVANAGLHDLAQGLPLETCEAVARFQSLHTCILHGFSLCAPVFFAMRDARASASEA